MDISTVANQRPRTVEVRSHHPSSQVASMTRSQVGSVSSTQVVNPRAKCFPWPFLSEQNAVKGRHFTTRSTPSTETANGFDWDDVPCVPKQNVHLLLLG